MTGAEEFRRGQSARHYLMVETLALRLQPTVSLAARALEFPTAMVNILDEDTQHTITRLGLTDLLTTPREEALCDAVIRSGQPLVVEDATADARFADYPSVRSGAWGTYVGVPLIGRESLPVGVLCVIDPKSRRVHPEQLARLVEFGKVVEDQLDLMRRLKAQRQDGSVATAELSRAIGAGEIVPWYQAIVELPTGRTVGYEALARWVHPSGAVSDPNSFVPLAEDSDLILALDLSVMRQAMADLRVWQLTDPTLRMSVNLSSRHFDQPGWVHTIAKTVSSAGVGPESVDLELTETQRLPVGENDAESVVQLQRLGFRILLDDFGTGWATLEYLLRLPADGIKIDRIMSLALGTPVGDTLTAAIAALARNLNLTTTIEGVETSEQAALAVALGCQFAQGYLWSRPAPAAAVVIDPQVLPVTQFRPVGPVLPVVDRRAVAVPAARGWSPEGEPNSNLAAAVMEATPDATAVVDRLGTIVAVNRAWRMFALDNGGSPATTGVGVSYLQVCARAADGGSAEARRVHDDLLSVLAGTPRETELEYPCPSPAVHRWFVVRISRLTESEGAVISHVNITRRKMAEAELVHGAFHDPLTGLANRTLLGARLISALTTTEVGNGLAGVGVLVMDLDGFKSVNDDYGHACGDEVLQTVAHRLQTLMRKGDTVGRLGGDEFVVIVPGIGADRLAALQADLDRSLQVPHHIFGRAVKIGGSVGSYLANLGDDAKDALHSADQAMYVSKQRRKLIEIPEPLG